VNSVMNFRVPENAGSLCAPEETSASQDALYSLEQSASTKHAADYGHLTLFVVCCVRLRWLTRVNGKEGVAGHSFGEYLWEEGELRKTSLTQILYL